MQLVNDESHRTAHIAESGYASYEGARTGRISAIVVIAIASIHHVLGLGRPARHKVLPVLVVIIAYLPAVVIAGISVLTSSLSGGVTGGVTGGITVYADYYITITFAIILFTALVSPEVLTSDRSNGMLPLYLSTPLSRNDYLLAKTFSLISVLTMVTVGPQLLLLVGYTAADAGPPSFGNWLLTLARIAVSGLAVAVIYTSVALAITAVAKRRSFASIAIVLLILISTNGAAVAVYEADFNELLFLLAFANLTGDLVLHIFAYVEVAGSDGSYSMPETGMGTVVLAYLAWVLLGIFSIWAGNRRIGSER